MTTRIGQPDTEADIRLRECLSVATPVSFVMIAGAGSGKTTSLVKALDYVGKTHGHNLKRKGQKVVCITYTEIAEQEIWIDVGQNSLFHVSTIHSFLWTLIRPFQTDIRTWVASRINEKITEAQDRISKPRTQAQTKIRLQSEIKHNESVLSLINSVSRFTYGTGSNYEKGILGHDDIIKMVPSLILERPLLRRLIIESFPYIFVDESQDTTESVIGALKAIDAEKSNKFCLGFFGDPTQKIYANGIGEISEEANWVRIEKPENFRCPPKVLSVINNIRTGGDGLIQTQGRHEVDIQGSAKLFILPADDFRGERLKNVRKWLADENHDPLWLVDGQDSDVRILVIVHRMAAVRLGFATIYSAFNDDKPLSSLKDGFLDGTSWAVNPFLSYILPLLKIVQNNNKFDLISFLRKNSPLLIKEKLKGINIPEILGRLQEDVNYLVTLFDLNENFTVADVLRHVRDKELITLEDRINEYLSAYDTGQLPTTNEDELLEEDVLRGGQAMTTFFTSPAKQMLAYQIYIEKESPFSTQQGIKGAEFNRVLTILDDEEGSYSLFSYNKYFGITPLSETDEKNINEGTDSVIDRTRRLFYVTCSRATKDLAVVLFAADVNVAYNQVLASNIFPEEDIHILTEYTV